MASIEVAAHAGACYGVERALSLVARAARGTHGPVRTLGPLIHNPAVVADLADAGVTVAADIEEIEGGTVVLRTHGVVPDIVERARRRGLTVIDATCPYVKRVHAAARRLARQGYQLLVVGEPGHPEVEGIVGHAGALARVVVDVADLDGVELAERIGVVVQTTQTPERLRAIVDELLGRCSELCCVNTICAATIDRQRAAAELAARADAMVVIGGRNSANTGRLAEICARACSRVHHIEDADEIRAAWFAGAGLIGVTAGASTPAAHIEGAVARISEALGPI